MVENLLGPFVWKDDSWKMETIDECQFLSVVVYFYNDEPAYTFPICRHPQIFNLSDKKVIHQQDSEMLLELQSVLCTVDSCPFMRPVPKDVFGEIDEMGMRHVPAEAIQPKSEAEMRELDKATPVTSPSDTQIHADLFAIGGSFMVAPPPDFWQKARIEVLSASRLKIMLSGLEVTKELRKWSEG